LKSHPEILQRRTIISASERELLSDAVSNFLAYISIDYSLHQNEDRFGVVHRPASELIRSLRAVLQSVEETFASPADQSHITELKRILLLRIADLEFVGAAVEMANAEEAENHDRVQEAVPPQDVIRPSVIRNDPEAA
jgi:hypothetical protein